MDIRSANFFAWPMFLMLHIHWNPDTADGKMCPKLDLRNRLVSICVDGAAVNLGVHYGLSALLKEDMPWLVAVHCMNHRLELAAKDACITSFLDEISTMLLNLHYMYEKSPKRLRELQMLAELMEESIHKPDKANGTRWLQHKSRALSTLLLGYPVIVAHLKSKSSDESNLKPVPIQWLCQETDIIQVCTAYPILRGLLNPLASFSCSLQADLVDLSFCIAKLKSLLSSLEHLKGDTLDSTSELAKFIMSVDCEQDRAEFRGVMLTAVRQNVLDAFHSGRSAYVDSDAAVRPPTVKTVKLGDTVGLTASVTVRKSE